MNNSQHNGQAAVQVEPVVDLDKLNTDHSLGNHSLGNQKPAAGKPILSQRQEFIRVVLATLVFVVVWKTSNLMHTGSWGGGAFCAVLMCLFPTVFDWRSYELTKKYGPLAGRILMCVMILALGISFNILIDRLHIH
jgi:hypothetical protein